MSRQLAPSNPVVEFLNGMLSEGRPVVGTDQQPGDTTISQAVEFLLEFEQQYRLTLAGTPPVPSRAALEWSTRAFYRAAQFLVFRNLGEELLEQQVSVPCPVAPCPSVCYAVDLTFRFLPDLVRLARAAAQNDPLIARLLAWAGDWPLSSVSVTGVSDPDIDGFMDQPTLRMLYVDRILAAKDLSRLNDERVRQAIRSALGAYPELAPEFAKALNLQVENSK